MRVNLSKTKLMLFNPCNSITFKPQFAIQDKQLDVVTEVRLLGLQLDSNLKWKSNTSLMVSKASKRLWILHRLKNLGAQQTSLVEVYVKQIRCLLEFGTPAWQGSITAHEKTDIERVQRNAVRIILGRRYTSYKDALQSLNLEYLEQRRINICLKFALKTEAHPKFKHWFIQQTNPYNTRGKQRKYKEIYSKHQRYSNSPLGYLTRLLNMHYKRG